MTSEINKSNVESSVWTWVRADDGPWFPVRGSDPNVKGGYTKGDSVMLPDEAKALRDQIAQLRTDIANLKDV